MTRQEFVEDVYSWGDLIAFCCDEGLSHCEDVYTDNDKDECINEDLIEMARDASNWLDLLDTLRSIPTGCYYYRKDDYGEWYGLCDEDSDFNDTKDEILNYCDENNIWDEEVEESELEETEEATDDDTFEVDESASVEELMSVCNSQLQRIKQESENEDELVF